MKRINRIKGGQIAKKNIRCVKEFCLRGGILFAPLHSRRWGKARKGMVLRQRDTRSRQDCARGVHAWKPWGWKQSGFRFADSGSRVAWHCIIPKGTWYHIGDNKF